MVVTTWPFTASATTYTKEQYHTLAVLRLHGAGVVSRKFSKELGRSRVVETSQTGAIVVGDEGVETGIAFGMAEKAAVVGGAVLRHPGKMLAEAAVARPCRWSAAGRVG